MQVYRDLEESQVVHTAWALLALISAQWHLKDRRPLEKGVAYLIAAQQESGDWPQQHITGVFNRNCMISYSNYRFAACLLICYLHYPCGSVIVSKAQPLKSMENFNFLYVVHVHLSCF